MNTKQRISLLTALALPALALSAFLALTPKQAKALSCPGGTFKAGPCNPSGGCQSGTGTCYSPGSNGIYVFCPNHPGPGICEGNGVVCCTQ